MMGLDFDIWTEKNAKYIVIVWLLAFLVLLPFSVKLFNVVSYNITGGNDPVLVINGTNLLSNQSKPLFSALNQSFYNEGYGSIYSAGLSLLTAMYRQIKISSDSTELLLYAQYNQSPSTASPALRQLITSETEELEYNSTVNYSEAGAFSVGQGLSSFINDVVNNYSNSTPQYISHRYALSSYPILPNATTMASFINRGDNTTIVYLINENDSYSSSVALHLSQDFGVGAYVTGSGPLVSALESTTSTGTSTALLFGVIIAVIITGLLFFSFVGAFVPLAIVGLDIAMAYGVFYIIFKYILNSTLSFFDPAVTSILMLGLATDYLVYLMYRYRQERRAGASKSKSARTSLTKAGRAVLTSGLSVIGAYIVLYLFNLAFLGPSGLINAIGVSIVLVSALTLMPALLHVFGDKLLYPNKSVRLSSRRILERIVEFDNKHSKLIIGIFITVAVASIYVFLNVAPGFNFLGLLPNSAAKNAFYVETKGFGYDVLEPLLIRVNRTTTGTLPFGSIISLVNGTPGIALTKTSINSSTLQITAFINNTAFSKVAINAYNSIDSQLSNRKINYTISGTAASMAQGFNPIHADIPLLLLILGVIIFLILFVQIYSLYTPIRLVLMLAAIVFIANAVMTLLFRYALGLPIIIIAQLFLITNIMGVGVDYDIFLVMRIKENLKGGNEEAIKEGLVKNGPVIASVGVILAAMFLSLSVSGIPMLSEIGFVVAIGILLDTFISILFVIPAMMFVLSKYNWWPGWSAK
jgi:RND superfamily putative drug exporter